jgi:hypothetical protein
MSRTRACWHQRPVKSNINVGGCPPFFAVIGPFCPFLLVNWSSVPRVQMGCCRHRLEIQSALERAGGWSSSRGMNPKGPGYGLSERTKAKAADAPDVNPAGISAAPHLKSRRSCSASRRRLPIWALRFSASAVWAPCFSAFLLPRGAPDPLAPLCIRHRFLPRTAGERQGRPGRVLAPQRGLASIGAVFRLCLPTTNSVA